MADPRAKEIARRYHALKADRSNHETLWQEIAELVRPMRADFNIRRMPGERRGLQVFDSTPSYASEGLASGLWSMVSSSANDWFSLTHPDEALARSSAVKLWLDEVARIMRAAFQSNGGRFYAGALEVYADLVCFGTAVHWTAEAAEPGRLTFSNRPLAECMICQDDEETVDGVIRRFEWTTHQAMARWGQRAPEAVRKAYDRGDYDAKFWFLHSVEPNRERIPSRRDARGKRFLSLHISEAGEEVVQEGGYEEFPYQVPRWSLQSRGLYGDSPAMLALADIKTLQAMEKTQLVAAQKAADPPLLAADENALRSVRVTPGGITYGAVDSDGRPLVQTLQSGASFNLTLEMAEQKRNAIRTAYYAALMTMIATPGGTATEWLIRQEEQLRQMGPHLGRIQAEFLDPLVDRVFGVLWRMGAFPPPPPELVEQPEIKVEYSSPLAKAQKSSEAAQIQRALEAVTPVLTIDPGAADNFDWDEVTRGLADGFAVPARMLRDPRMVKALRAQKAEQAAAMQQAQMLAGAAQPAAQGAQAVKTMVEAQTMAEAGA